MLHDIAPPRLRVDRRETETPAMLAELQEHREQLMGMMRELQANQVALERLRDWYGVFVFTGGEVPSGRCELSSITAYLDRPFAADRICVADVQRYRHLVEAMMEPRQNVAAGPRTRRCRKDIGDAFDLASSEMQTLETALESDLAKLVDASESQS